MNRYRVRRSLGQGSFGRVVEAEDRADKSLDNLVAIKQISEIWHDADCLKKILRELRILRNVTHPNILRLRKSILDLEKEELYIITDLCLLDLHKFIQDNRRYNDLSSNWVNIYKMMNQILCAVKYIHDRNIMHRDIKPANILLDKSYNIKLCDFGLARLFTHTDEVIPEFKNNPLADSNLDILNDLPFDNKLTEYVVTRWYRAPEVSLSNGKYSFGQDIWSTAVTFAELITRRPLFPGRSYIHQIQVIIEVLGIRNLNGNDCDFEMDPNGRKLVKQILDKVKTRQSLRDKVKPCFQIYNMVVWDFTLQLLNSMLSFNPNNRITANEALRSPLFAPFEGKKVPVDSLPMIPFLYMKDIEQSNENIEALRQLLQTEVLKSSFSEPVGSRITSKQSKKRHLMTTSLTSVSPYLSNKPFEELKDEFIRSDLDDHCNSVKKSQSENFDYNEFSIDSKCVTLKSQKSKASPVSIRSAISSIIPNWLTQRKDDIDENERIISIEKKKAVTVFCCLPRTISNISP